MKMRRWLLGMALLSVAAAAPAEAGTIRSPTPLAGFTLTQVGGLPKYLADQSDLTPTFTSGVTDFNTYISLGPTEPQAVSPLTGWAVSASLLPGYLEFDLGSDYALSTFVIWTQNSNLALKSFTLTSALDVGFTSGVTVLGTFNAAIGLNAQTFGITGAGEFVRLQVNSGQGGTAVIIGEVAFETDPIPEPASVAILGMGLVGLLRARRRG